MSVAMPQAERTVRLHVMTPHRREMDIPLPDSKLVEELIVASHLHGKNVQAYHKGKKLRVGRRLWEYKLSDGARIEMRIEGFSVKAVRYLKRAVGLGDAEIERLRCQYLTLHGNGTGTLSKDEFYYYYGTQYPRTVSDHLFDLIDTDNNKYIDIDEWVYAKNILEAGGTTRLKFIFDFFDADGDGNITERELLRISVPLYHLCFGVQQPDAEKARSHAKRVFQQLDTDRNGKLSFEEFKLGYKSDSALRPGLLAR